MTTYPSRDRRERPAGKAGGRGILGVFQARPTQPSGRTAGFEIDTKGERRLGEGPHGSTSPITGDGLGQAGQRQAPLQAAQGPASPAARLVARSVRQPRELMRKLIIGEIVAERPRRWGG